MEHEEVVEAVANWFKADREVALVTKGYGRGFPNPDITAQYRQEKVAFVECKPSNAGGREYMTGLGQSLAYLIFADFSYLAMPEKELNMYQKYFWIEEIGLLSVKENLKVQLIRPAKESKVILKREEPRVRGYGYYRDLRPQEIHSILRALQAERNKQRHLDKGKIEDAVWREVLKLRNIRSQRQKNSWILNIKLLLRDLQLVNLDDYSLTENGFRLLQLGTLPDEKPYIDELARCFLLNANYIDIITLIQRLNDEHVGFTSVQDFKEKLAKAMVEEKMATERTDVIRDLQDIPRILKDLNIITEWKKYGFNYRYNINWKRVLSLIK
ncbi:hypothetical protein KEJ45_03180 [Candidatus Bathyarchaeota archaeon]|nr:hypothetical protein [Candidatus Bathyarchaeota archaeon]